MPDHLHVLLQGDKPNASLPDFVRNFKQRSAYAFRQHAGDPPWQRSYYDHVLRKDENIREIARYIFENPVRKGLIGDFREFPFSGPPESLNLFA